MILKDDGTIENMTQGFWGTCPWDINEDGVLTIYGGEGESSDFCPWENYSGLIKSIVVEADVVLPKDCSYLFSSLRKCRSMDLSLVDTSQVTDMSYMFDGCDHLVNLNLSGFDTSNVTDMSSMFSYCNMSELDLRIFETMNVTNMSDMFYGCYNLKNVNLSGFDTSKVTKMIGMFCYCVDLINLDLSVFDTTNVTDMNLMFEHCDSLAEIKVGSTFSFKGDGSTYCILPENKWRSVSDGITYTEIEISENRNNYSDIYIGTIEKRGRCGSCKFELDIDGVVTVYGGNFGGAWYNYETGDWDTPWINYGIQNKIKINYI